MEYILGVTFLTYACVLGAGFIDMFHHVAPCMSCTPMDILVVSVPLLSRFHGLGA